MADLKLYKYKRPQGPCKDCADRCENCHANCERYISWKAECDKAHNMYVKTQTLARELEDYTCKKIRKYGKRNNMR